MINALAKKAVEWLNSRGAIDEAQSDVYIYGADLVAYTLFSTAGLLLVGAAFHRFWETVLIVLIFYTNQTIGGGFHATTHIRCFLIMLIGLIISLLTFYLPANHWSEFVILMFSILVLESIPLTLHPNKTYLQSNRGAFIKRSRIIAAIQGFIVLALIFINISVYTHACCLGLFVSAISRLSGLHNSSGAI